MPRYNIFIQSIGWSSRRADTRHTTTSSCSYCCLVVSLLPGWSLGRLDYLTAVCCSAERSCYSATSQLTCQWVFCSSLFIYYILLVHTLAMWYLCFWCVSLSSNAIRCYWTLLIRHQERHPMCKRNQGKPLGIAAVRNHTQQPRLFFLGTPVWSRWNSRPPVKQKGRMCACVYITVGR